MRLPFPRSKSSGETTKGLRLGMNAAAAVLHVVDYVMQNSASDPKTGNRSIDDYREDARQNFSFEVVEAFAVASKHCNLRSRPGFDSGTHMVAQTSFIDEMVGESFIGGTVGGITIDWSEGRWINLTLALQDTLKVMEGDFPEITR